MNWVIVEFPNRTFEQNIRNPDNSEFNNQATLNTNERHFNENNEKLNQQNSANTNYLTSRTLSTNDFENNTKNTGFQNQNNSKPGNTGVDGFDF